jgi:hypothetical protein
VTLVPALRERFAHALPAAMTILRELSALRGNFDQGAARAYNGALQVVDEHPWGAKTHAFAVTFLPAFVRDLFQVNGVAHLHDLVNHPAMQALAMSFQFAFSGGLAPPGGLVASALFPGRRALAPLPGTASLIEVLGIGCTPLPVHFAFQATQVPGVRGEFGAEQVQTRLCLPRDDGDGGGSHIQADEVAANRVLGLLIGGPAEHQLHAVAIPPAVSSLRAGTGGTASDQAGIFDRVLQAIRDHRILPVDEGRQLLILPEHIAGLALFSCLQHKAQPGIVSLVLDAIQSPALALKAHAFGLA